MKSLIQRISLNHASRCLGMRAKCEFESIIQSALTELANPLLEKIEQLESCLTPGTAPAIMNGLFREAERLGFYRPTGEHALSQFVKRIEQLQQQFSAIESQNKVLRDALEKIWCLPTEKQNVHIEARVICDKALSSTAQPQPQKITFNQAVDKVLQQEKQPQKEQRYNAAEVTKAAYLSGNWRHSHGMIFCGTLRIAKADFDTNPSPEYQWKVFTHICDTLNTTNDDSELLDWLEKNKATVGWNDRCGAFIVQRKDQTVGHIGIGSTPSEAIRDAMKEGE